MQSLKISPYYREIGCYKDDNARTMHGYAGDNITLNNCFETAKRKKSKYFSMQTKNVNAGTALCFYNDPLRYGKASGCVYKGGRLVGGGWRNATYEIINGRPVYKGCYIDGRVRAMSNGIHNKTWNECFNLAKKGKGKHFAIQAYSDATNRGWCTFNTDRDYARVGTSRLTYNRLTEEGKWVIDPKGQYMKNQIYPKLARRVSDIFDEHDRNKLFYSEDERLDALMHRFDIVRPTNDLYDKALKELAPKVYVQRSKLKDYLIN